jgi:hypothetical protein
MDQGVHGFFPLCLCRPRLGLVVYNMRIPELSHGQRQDGALNSLTVLNIPNHGQFTT